MRAESAANSATGPVAASHLRSRPTWLRAAPALVLLVAIVAQATLMNTMNADRQSGSGFAMFSSVDFAGTRSVTVTATYNGNVVDVRIPSSAADQVDGLLRLPTEDRAARLARDLDELAWTLEDDRVVATADGIGLERISVTVRGLTADGRELGSEVLAQAVSP